MLSDTVQQIMKKETIWKKKYAPNNIEYRQVTKWTSMGHLNVAMQRHQNVYSHRCLLIHGDHGFIL